MLGSLLFYTMPYPRRDGQEFTIRGLASVVWMLPRNNAWMLSSAPVRVCGFIFPLQVKDLLDTCSASQTTASKTNMSLRLRAWTSFPRKNRKQPSTIQCSFVWKRETSRQSCKA